MPETSQGFDNKQIYEPLKAYSSHFKEAFKENAQKFFDQLAQKAKTNIEENRITNKKINELIPVRDNLKKVIARQSGFRTFLIVLIIAGLIAAGIGIFLLTSAFTVGALVAAIAGPFAMVISFMLIRMRIAPRLRTLRENKQEVLKQLDEQINIAEAQMASLNRLMYPNMGVDIFKESVPLIKLDNNFDSRRLDYLMSNYGLGAATSPEQTTLYVQSGEIVGNPFFICNDLTHELGTKTYTGFKTIRWTTTRRTQNGVQTVTHSQTLTATVNKPCPYYTENTYLVYGNEAAPDLTFSRHETDVENMSEKQIQRKVAKKIKALKKKARKQTMKGNNFTVMSNYEFEALFNASDRDHETQFRLLFTPLAQRQLLQIMKEKNYGFGDDFDFYKKKKINIIIPKHLNKFKLNMPVDQFRGRDFDVMKEFFMTYQTQWFRQIYFALAPVIAIPLYQQMMPKEFIYKDLYNSYVSFYEHEMCANRLNVSDVSHPMSRTRNIIKTKIASSSNNCDKINVESKGYATANRLDFIPRRGGDGRTHLVPVPWTEYIPVKRDTTIDINIEQRPSDETMADRIERMVSELQDADVNNEDQAMRVGTLLARVLNCRDSQVEVVDDDLNVNPDDLNPEDYGPPEE